MESNNNRIRQEKTDSKIAFVKIQEELNELLSHYLVQNVSIEDSLSFYSPTGMVMLSTSHTGLISRYGK